MTASEEKITTARKVLQKIAAYDPSYANPAKNAILAWAEQLTIANISEPLALEAVASMYAAQTNPEFRPHPGVLVNEARRLRREKSMRDGPLDPPGEIPPPSGPTRGLYLDEDPAGWPYAYAATTEEREMARCELDARIDRHIKAHPELSRADAERVIRVGDRKRAEEYLRRWGRDSNGRKVERDAAETVAEAVSRVRP